MDIIASTNTLLSLGTIAGQIFLVVVALYLVVTQRPIVWLGKHGMKLAFFTSLVAMSASLFYSQYVGFPPCDLCWLQRVFMYPLVILLGMAWVKKDLRILDYSLVLAVIGGAVSALHNYMYYSDGGLNALCQLSGLGVSCVKRYVFEFNYVTIPLMSLTAFALVIAFLVFQKYHAKNTPTA